jgi:phenylalanyl-tRNA synthetase beta chain
VMLALGSPLHAFDLTALRGGEVVVRRAGAGERIRTLDGEERTLAATDLVIADAERPIALAGIMGGEETEVGAETASVLLEAANFDRFTIYATSERLKLRTEASSRWEKGVDPHAAERAAAYATELIVEHAGGRNAGAVDVHGTLPARPVVRFRPERANALIGLSLPEEQQLGILRRLGFEATDDDVVVPTWRAAEVTREVDVIEEVARFVLDDVPFTLPVRREMSGRLTALQQLRRRVEDVLVGLGFAETYTPSLRAEAPEPEAYALVEPISVELTYLRTSLLPSLVDTAMRNREAGNDTVDLFEIARIYRPSGGSLPDEHLHVGAILEGGFLRAKGVVETIERALKIDVPFTRGTHPLMHPGKTAQLPFGDVGELRPGTLEGEWSVLELDLAALTDATTGPVVYEDVVTYPAVKQDLAFVVDEEVAVGDIVAAMHEAAGPRLRSARLFDVYRGGQIPEGRKSLAFSVSFQSPEQTLSDEDASALRDRIVEALADRFSAELRA